MEASRARLFVLFLDDSHVEVSGSHNIRKPLTDMLERLIGPDDLFGVMTPEMSATQVAFARKTTTIDGILSTYWHWGERDRVTTFDPVETKFNECFPGTPTPNQCDKGIAAEMILRRREVRTLDALEDLARYLRGVREERKAIIVISDGWQLYKPNSDLARPVCGEALTGQPMGIGPGAKLFAFPDKKAPTMSQHDCDQDRLNLAQIDDERRFKLIPDEANRGNVSFYTVDPRGLPAWDASLGPRDYQPPPDVDQANLRNRIDTLQTLAGATDGLAIVNSNDLDRGMKRIVDDLTSYYLLGYYSTEKLDGRFHRITVHVKRSGVNVRARRGYQAPTQAEVNVSKATAAFASGGAGHPEAEAAAHAVEAAIAPLVGSARELPLRVQVAAGWKANNAAIVHAVGEVAPGDAWKDGGEAEITLLRGSGGAALATAKATIAPGSRTFRVALAASEPIAAGDYAVRVRVLPQAALALSERSESNGQVETVRLAVPAAPESSGAVLFRKGPLTGNKEVVTADPRFRRSEQMRVEVPAAGATPMTARLLDRSGKAVPVPVTTAARDDADGSRWQTAQLLLAPLAAGDYVIELAGGAGRVLIAFRIVP
jgi:VWFA-related protein